MRILWLIALAGCANTFLFDDVDCRSISRDADLWLDRGRAVMRYEAEARVTRTDDASVVSIDGSWPENGRGDEGALRLEWLGEGPGRYLCEEGQAAVHLTDGVDTARVDAPGTWCEVRVAAFAPARAARVSGTFIGELADTSGGRSEVCGAFETVVGNLRPAGGATRSIP